jgi:hypothetical protein
MPHEQHHSGDPAPPSGVSPDAVRRGHESLTTNTRAVGWAMLIFWIMAAFMLWGLWGLMKHYIDEQAPEDAAVSAAPALPVALRSPLEPMPMHNEADWQDLVDLREKENVQFQKLGWNVDQRTGQAMIPAAVAATIARRYGGQGAGANAPSPLQFPPPMAPARAGPQESLDSANLFPPVGAAGIEEQKSSIKAGNAPEAPTPGNPTRNQGP